MRAAGFTVLAATLGLAQPRGVVPADIEEGARNFGNFCAQCHGADGNAMPGADLTRPALRRAATDDQIANLILSGIPGTAMPPNNLNQRQVFTIVQFIRSLSTAPPRAGSGGSAARGQAIFEGQGQCLNCHRVRDRGGFLGPPLTDIGVLRRAANLEQSLLDPAAQVLPQNAVVAVVTQQGENVRGRIVNADTHTIQILDSGGKLRSFRRETVRNVNREAGSPMPSYRDRLTREEIADVVAYLSSLRGF
jgi:putative heme-binding domain-containing protein